MPYAVEVQSRVVGGSRDDALSPIVLTLFEETITTAELIARTVEEQVHDLMVARRLDSLHAERLLAKQYYTSQELAEQIDETGAVRYRRSEKPAIDVQAQTTRALNAFKAGEFIVIVDGRQVETLVEPVTLKLDTRVTFLRLMPLVGG